MAIKYKIDPAIPFLGIYPADTCTCAQKCMHLSNHCRIVYSNRK